MPLLTLPSGLWRIALVIGVPLTSDFGNAHHPVWERPYILSLTVVSEGLALLTLGLIQPWGEVVPHWFPFLGGRRIPILAAVVPAGLGAAAVTAFCLYAVLNDSAGPPGTTLQHAVLLICYVPLAGWGPLLAAVTVAYYRRRSARAAVPSRQNAGSGFGGLV
ncbi:hypothetical protein ABZ746_38780 [Streptomyces sp. NPDC020096]